MTQPTKLFKPESSPSLLSLLSPPLLSDEFAWENISAYFVSFLNDQDKGFLRLVCSGLSKLDDLEIKKNTTMSLVNYAARNGFPLLLRLVFEEGAKSDCHTLPHAVASGNFECVKYLMSRGLELDNLAAEMAAMVGNIPMLEFIGGDICRSSMMVCSEAAVNGHLHVLKFLHDEFEIDFDIEVSMNAAHGGHLDIIKYLHETGCDWDGETCASARTLEILRYLHENGCSWNEETCESAANLEILKYAHENGCPWDEDTCASAANLEILKYAHENGCPWNKDTCAELASDGKLDCLKYALENGCPYDEDTCASAANLEILKYAREFGCPWDKGTCERMAEGGKLDCLQYALENGCPYDDLDLFASAWKPRHYDICLYLVQRL